MALEDLSVFNKWRALIALAHVDKKFRAEERDFLIEHLQRVAKDVITDEQKATLINDFKEPKEPDIFFSRIDNRIEKLDFLRLAHFLFWADGDFDARERRVFDYLKASVGSSLNLPPEIIDEITSLKGQKKTLQEILTTELAKKKKP